MDTISGEIRFRQDAARSPYVFKPNDEPRIYRIELPVYSGDRTDSRNFVQNRYALVNTGECLLVDL